MDPALLAVKLELKGRVKTKLNSSNNNNKSIEINDKKVLIHGETVDVQKCVKFSTPEQVMLYCVCDGNLWGDGGNSTKRTRFI